MPYRLIKGEFHIFYPDLPRQGPEPDGDTLKFLPDNPSLVENLHVPGSRGPDFNGCGMINLRFEGIDALETHFEETHQNLDLAEDARDSLLQRIGFGSVEFWSDAPFKVKQVENHPRRGFILAKNLDPFGRIVSFVYSGEVETHDGANIWLDAPSVNSSLNAQLLVDGLVYPAFYTTLPVELRDQLGELTQEARTGNKGLWPLASASIERPATIVVRPKSWTLG